MKVGEKIKATYYNDNPMTSKDYEHSRKMFVIQGMTGSIIATLTAGAFLTGFLNYIGISDDFNGLLSVIPVLAGTVQLFSSMIVESLSYRKLLVSIMCFIHRLLLASYVLIPLFVQSTKARLTVFTIIFGVSYVFGMFVTPPSIKWLMDLIPDHMKGKFYAHRDAMILIVVTLVSLTFGKVLDVFKANGHQYTGFLIIHGFLLIITIIDFIVLSKAREVKCKVSTNKIRLKDIFILPFGNKAFRKVILLSVMWNLALQMGSPYIAVYQVTTLKLDYAYIMMMGLIANVVRVFSNRYWGKLSDNKSWSLCLTIGVSALAIFHSLWALVDITNVKLLAPILFIGIGVASSGINISYSNLQYKLAPEENKTVYIGTASAIGGVLGFLSALVGSKVVKSLEGKRVSILNFSLGNMQMVFLLSGILLAICAIYIFNVVKKEELKNTNI